MPCADLKVLFVAAAGPRRGFGHLVRCRSLARAMGVRPLVAVRGGSRVVDAALVLGCDVIPSATPKLVGKVEPDVLVVDDPIATQAGRWIAAGRRAGSLVVSIHDLGLGCLDADVVVDGSVTRAARATRGETLAGPEYAVLDPGFLPAEEGSGKRKSGNGAAKRELRSSSEINNAFAFKPQTLSSRSPRVLISLGGGPRARRAAEIAEAIAEQIPSASIRVVGGFMASIGARDRRITWVDAPRGLRGELTRSDIAVLGGGVSMYEACAVGVPTVGVPVVRAQEPTVAAFIRRRAAVGVPRVTADSGTIAMHAARLATNAALRRSVANTARKVVDGRGALRVVAAIAARAANGSYREDR